MTNCFSGETKNTVNEHLCIAIGYKSKPFLCLLMHTNDSSQLLL